MHVSQVLRNLQGTLTDTSIQGPKNVIKNFKSYIYLIS